MNQELINRTIEKLRSGVATVLFSKVDGTPRKMKATLVRELIPAEYRPHGSNEPPEHLIRAFDLEKNGWRSMRKDLLIALED